jgi:hypothetical protein
MSGATVVVDFGSSHTVTVLCLPGRAPRLVTVDGEPWMSSAVFLTRDDQLVAGQDALRLAVAEPARLETSVKARLDDRELLLGDIVLPVATVVRAVLARALLAATGLAGGPVDHLVLTHPAGWAPARVGVLRAAAAGLVPRISTVLEPLGAAASAEVAPGGLLAVLDLGGGSSDVAVVRRTQTGVELFGHATIPDLGGADLDRRLMDHLLPTWRELAELEQAVFRQEVRRAKELLSRHLQVEVALPNGPDVPLTRGELETVIGPDLDRITAFTLRTVLSCGVEGRQLSAVQLVGGSARIPMLGQLLGEVLPVPIRLDDQPEAAVALGAAVLTAPPAEPVPTRPAPATDEWAASKPRWPALLALVLAVLVAAGLAGYGYLAPPASVAGTAAATGERFTLPAPEPGEELTTGGATTDGLVMGQPGIPTRLFDGTTDLDWTVRAVFDPADAAMAAAGAPAPAAGSRWVLVDVLVRARAPAAAPYYVGDTYLLDDRGLLIPPVRDVPMPPTCPTDTPPALAQDAVVLQCLAFQVSARTPVGAVVVGRPGQPGVRVPVPSTAAGSGAGAGASVPLGAVRPLRVGTAVVPVAVVDVLTEASAYADGTELTRPGLRAVVVRAVAETRSAAPTLPAGLRLRDDRDQPIAPVGFSTRHGCGAAEDGRVVVCAVFAVPTELPLRSVTWAGDAGETLSPALSWAVR